MIEKSLLPSVSVFRVFITVTVVIVVTFFFFVSILQYTTPPVAPVAVRPIATLAGTQFSRKKKNISLSFGLKNGLGSGLEISHSEKDSCLQNKGGISSHFSSQEVNSIALLKFQQSFCIGVVHPVILETFLNSLFRFQQSH